MSGTREIALTQGKSALVDADDYDRLVGLGKWHFSDMGYAVRRDDAGTVRMHRIVNNTPRGLYTDHKNGDKLDNRKANLRSVTQKENAGNRKTTKGYCLSEEKGLWIVRYKGKHYSYARTLSEAKELYKAAKSGVPKVSKLHPRRKLLPRGVYFMQPQAQKGYSPYYIRPRREGKHYFRGYFGTVREAVAAYNNFLVQGG